MLHELRADLLQFAHEAAYTIRRTTEEWFYSENGGLGNTFFRDALLAYLIVGILFAYRKAPAGRVWSKLKFSILDLLPAWVYRKQSFRLDLQWYALSAVGITGVLLNVLAFTFLVRRAQDLFFSFGFYDTALSHWLRAELGALSPDGYKVFLVVVTFVVADFSSYLSHRIEHITPFLWQFHKIHHYPEQISFLAGFRNHPIDQAFQALFSVLLVSLAVSLLSAAPVDAAYLANPENWWLYLFILVQKLVGKFNHTHFPITYGKILGKLMYSPKDHMVHHSALVLNRNFGSGLVIWDRLFGSYHEIKDMDEYRLHSRNLGIPGMADDLYPTVVHALLVPFKDAWNVLRGAKEEAGFDAGAVSERVVRGQ